MKRLTVTLGVLVLAAGCATTPEKLRARGGAEIHRVAGSYQAVYRHLLGKARAHAGHRPSPVALSSTATRVEHALYPDLGRAEIALRWYGAAGTKTPFLFDISAAADGATTIAAYYGGGEFGAWRRKLRQWLAELAAYCPEGES